jgi:hypothetical protein
VTRALFASLTILAASCGSTPAARTTTAAACNTLIVSLGEAEHLEPERATADIRAVAAVCRRLHAEVDGGAQ